MISDASDSDSNKGKRFKQVFGTRWLSFEGSLEAVLANYSSLSSVLAKLYIRKKPGLIKISFNVTDLCTFKDISE